MDIAEKGLKAEEEAAAAEAWEERNRPHQVSHQKNHA